MDLRTVVVTGAGGHIGQHVATRLHAAGLHVRAAVRGAHDPQRHAALRATGVELVEADVTDANALDAALDGADAVVHLAAAYKRFAADPEEAILRPALLGTENMLAACKRHGIARLVYTSSIAAVGFAEDGVARNENDWNDKALNHYTRAKRDSERLAWRLAAEWQVPMVALCPATVIGPGFTRHTPSTLLFQRFLDGAMPALPPITLSYVDARDIADAHVTALLASMKGERYVLAGPSITLAQLAQRLAQLEPGLKLPRFEMGRFTFALLPFIDWLSHHIIGTAREMDRDIYLEMKHGRQIYDSSKAARELGWAPRPLMETLADTLAWLRNEKVAPI